MTYDQWKDPTYYDPPSAEDGLPDDDQILDEAVAAARVTPNEIHDALLGMIGLVHLITSRTDLPDDIRKALLTNHRYIDARTVAKTYL